MSAARHTHWGVEYRTNSSGRRWGWHLALQSIRTRKAQAEQAALDHFVSIGNPQGRWNDWHAMRARGDIRAVKLTITKVDA